MLPMARKSDLKKFNDGAAICWDILLKDILRRENKRVGRKANKLQEIRG